MALIDLSHAVADGMPVHPYDEPVALVHHKHLERDGFNDSLLSAGGHVGTHVDGPMHLTRSQVSVGEMPLERFCGQAWCFDVRGRDPVTLDAAELGRMGEGDIVLLATGFDLRYGSREYYQEHPVISSELAERLVERRIKLLGLDTPSPDRHPFSIHVRLLEQGIPILENLRGLERLPQDRTFELFAFPLKIPSDSSLVRAVARIADDSL